MALYPGTFSTHLLSKSTSFYTGNAVQSPTISYESWFTVLQLHCRGGAARPSAARPHETHQCSPSCTVMTVHSPEGRHQLSAPECTFAFVISKKLGSETGRLFPQSFHPVASASVGAACLLH